jgi:hypothetical protein
MKLDGIDKFLSDTYELMKALLFSLGYGLHLCTYCRLSRYRSK